ncbi:SDR family NAD(P)-dependent oxidoreductase [Paraburkholderia panacisoli]|uniref:SDR family NAD(P)-dependent oxidoreductase n=1 Tax=Paraburkholderia panacisoli TaxID=2603818 RepID=A0A5B0GZ47_9BURK|nr:type I polyketide synthase [Paraburkholderia panacisoli]KAA1008215.1 SDR family NAD(P)-dependent oxidoreductase [Paraburkholderia panacisoli]
MKKKIAIVGMACRFPGGVEGPDDFWQLLCDERDAVSAIPHERFGTAFHQHPAKREPGKAYTFAAGVLNDVAGFDAGFFGISPREATQMDPQQRLLLELAWEAFEDAGVHPAAMRGRDCGVFVGVAATDYGNRILDDLNSIDPYSATGNTLSIVSNRVSYMFDLRGPSMAVDTACSSSLVALHQAVQALQSGETGMALAGGVNLLLHPFGFVSFSKASMLSPRGRCRAFDATGDGYVRAEGGAFVLLKPLDEALADGDTIHAVIAGSGVNSNGHSHGGINVPAAATQAELLRSVYQRAAVDPRSLAYLEAHGTGTAVGDPIEARALIEAVSSGRAAADPLLIGSVKSNIGHLETASGMAGLLKAVLCLKHRAVPRSLHFDTPNPAIDFDGGRLRVVNRFTPLERGDAPLTIGINSFGFGGTNAHVIVTEAVEPQASNATMTQAPTPANAPLPPLVLTARAPGALAALAARYLARLQAGADWISLAAGAARRRQWHDHRAVVAPANLDEAHAALTALAEPAADALPTCVAQGQATEVASQVAFVYAGNGCQWAGMGKQLYAQDPVFRAALDEVDALWRADGNASLVAAMCDGVSAEWLAATENAQPLLFAMQVGITRVLSARGVQCDATLGHSVGEIAAAWASGALTLAEAVRVIRFRSGAQALTRGAGRMAAAGVGEAAAREWIERLGLAPTVEVAGTNSPEAVTFAGSPHALEAIGAALAGAGHFFQMLDLDYAFHSSHMDVIEPVVRDGLADLAPRDGHTRFVSTVTGDTLPGTALDAGYWWRNIREPVRFGDAIAHLANDRVRVFIEVAPHSILRTYVKQTLATLKLPGAVVPTLKRHHDSAEMLAHSILSAVAHGARVDLERFVPDAPRTVLPSYPWQREHHWIEQTVEGNGVVTRRVDHPLLGYRLHQHAFAWENQLDPQRVPMLADHVVDGGVAFPGAGYVEMALAAARTFFGTADVALENVEIRMPVVFQPQHAKLFRLAIDPRTASFTIETHDRMSEGPWNLNVTGRLLESGNTLGPDSVADASVIARLQASPAMRGDTLYASTTAIGLSYGPAFRWVQAVHVSADEALADLEAPSDLGGAQALANYLLHPALMDSGFHPLFAVLGQDGAAPSEARAAFVPVQIGRVDFLRGDPVRRVLARVHRRSPHSIVASFEFLDPHGAIVARLSACRFRRVDLAGRRHGAPARFAYALEARPLQAGFTAGTLPPPAVLVERANAQVSSRENAAGRTRHLTEILPLVDVLAGLHALEALDALDAFSQPALPAHPNPQLVARLAQIVVEDGLAYFDGARLVRDDEACAAMPARDALWRDVLAASPAHVAELTLLAHVGAALPRVLCDAAPQGAALLSPTGRSLVEQYFDAGPTWAHTRAMLAACVTQAVATWTQTRRVRVLEIGAASGDVLQPLDCDVPAGRCEYTLAGPQQLIGVDTEGHAHVQTLPFTLDEPLFSRYRDTVPFDVIVVNRLLGEHPDPLSALTSIVERLAPGGIVVLADARRGRFADIVFGVAGREIAATAHGALTPATLVSLCERAGLVDIVRDTEQDLDLEGTPTFIVARKPVANARQEAASQGERRALQSSASDGERWLIAQNHADAFGTALAGELTLLGCCVESAPVRDAAVWSARQPAGRRSHIVFIAPHVSPNADGAAVMQAQRGGALALAALVRELDVAGVAERGRLCVVTRGGAPFAVDALPHPEQASLWGLGRVIANEYPALSMRLIDVDQTGEQPAQQLATALVGDDGEEEVLLACEGRYVPRMLPAAQAEQRGSMPGDPSAAVLAFDMPGSLRNLEWFALPARDLAPGDVEIEPAATGLNFRDVMYAMGLLSDEAVETGFAGATIGMELSGRIVRVGADVEGWAPGDAVLGFAPASFATRVVTRATAIARKPEHLSFEEAATIPTTFFTAYYALCELARMRRGERILVHGGAGGVGIAAIQIARHLGAEVFATAGSDEKREFIRLLGADHVLDSRSLAFADEILKRTNGEGVDIVLNSLAGEAMVRSIDTLRPFGRFLELGKRDFYENSQIGLRPFRNNISYFGIDADQLMGVLPALTTRLFEAVMEMFANGALHPLPYRAFPAARAEEAFRYMQQARQIGKVLVTYPSGTPAPTRGVTQPTLQLDPQAAYLIVGGTGGLGFATARWMVARGARHLTLASRGGALDTVMQAEADRWRDQHGVTVSVVACDVTDAAALARLIDAIEGRGTPLKGVLHSAMRIDDGLLRNLDDARFAAVLEPKVAGAWNLHRATQRCELDFFVLYSSATTYLGNPGQGAYVAANSFLEALVAHRRAAGRPATFMAWGPIEDVGFLARHSGTREALQARIGGASITSDEAMAALEHALANGAAGEAVVRLDWRAISRGMPASQAHRYMALRTGGAAETTGEDGVLLAQVRALPTAEALALVEAALRSQIARILHMSPERIDLDRSVLDLGMDSLMGMELGMAVEESFGVKLSIMAIAEGATVHTLAVRIVDMLDERGDAGGEAADEMEAALVARHASDDEARAMLELKQDQAQDQKNQGAAPCKSTPALAE